MYKEKLIEEMAKDLCKECSQLFTNCHCISKPCTMCDLITERLIEKHNYCKIPKDSVVLSKEEYEALLLEQKRLIEMADRIPCGYVLKEEARKETAKEICEMGEGIYELSYRKSDAMPRLVAWIKSNFGVETKE